MRVTIRFALATSMALACTAPAPTRSQPTTTAADHALSAPLARRGAGNGSPADARPARAPRCRLSVTDAEGCGPGDVETLIEPVRARIERCRTASGGKLRVRVRKAASGKLAFDVVPGTTLDPAEQQCVLAALSTLDVDESSTAWAGLNARPTGFTSLITIEW